MDSEEELGLEDVAENGVGGVVKLEERTRVGPEDCRVALGGLLGSCCGGGESHIHIFLTRLSTNVA